MDFGHRRDKNVIPMSWTLVTGDKNNINIPVVYSTLPNNGQFLIKISNCKYFINTEPAGSNE